MAEATVRVQALDGRWENVGVDRVRDVYVEDLTCRANDAGSDTAAFTLRRNPGGIFPDIGAFTPIEIEIDGVKSWSGRVWEAPTREGADSAISVQARGWQYALDDDSYKDWYVHTDLSKWVDTRTFPNVASTNFRIAPEVRQDGGQIVMGWPAGAFVAQFDTVGVTLDLGAACNFIAETRFRVSTTAHASVKVYWRSSNMHDPLVTSSPAVYDLANSGTALSTFGASNYYQHTGNNFAGGPHRYFHIFLYYDGGGGDFGADNPGIIIKSITIHKEKKFMWYWPQQSAAQATDRPTAAYELSSLRASQVVTDAVQKAATGFATPTVRSSRYQDEGLSTPGLRAFWRMATKIADAGVLVEDIAKVYTGTGAVVGGGQPLTLVNAPTREVAGAVQAADPLGDPWDSAMTFNGSTQYASAANIGSSMQQPGYWMEALFKPTLNQLGIVMSVGSATTGYAIEIQSGADTAGDKLYITHPNVARYLVMTLVTGTWYHVVMTRDADSGRSRCWVNGVLKFDAATATPVTPAATVAVGAYPGATRFFTGTIDEALIAFNGSNPLWGTVGAANEDDLPVMHYQAAMARKDGTVQRTAFHIPEFAFPLERRTPREVGQAVNAFHDWQYGVNVEKEVVFKPRPSVATLDVGEWSGADFEDASANSAEDIYSKVYVQGTGADGQALEAARDASDLVGATLVATPVQLRDPNIAALTDWTAIGSGGGMALDSSIYATAPSSFSLTSSNDGGGNGQYQTAVLNYASAGGWSDTGFVFLAGVTYTLRFAASKTSGTNTCGVQFGQVAIALPLDYTQATITPIVAATTAAWQAGAAMHSVEWTPARNWPASQVNIRISPTLTTLANATVQRFDAFSIHTSQSGLLDRRGQVRSKILPVESRLTPAAANQIADIYLAGHVTAPFKGSLKVSGRGGVRQTIGGKPVPASQLLLMGGERINFTHRIDPDTGAVGRLGDIASVDYTLAEDAASVSIDNDRQRFEALLSRLAVVTGQIRT